MVVDRLNGAGDVPARFHPGSDFGAIVVRIFGWSTLTFLAAFLINDFLTVWRGWPGAFGSGDGTDVRAIVQIGLYGFAIIFATVYTLRNTKLSLRTDSQKVRAISSFLIRTAFWAVLLIGLIDVGLSFLRGEELLEGLAGKALAWKLTRAEVRGIYIHMPLILIAIAIAALTRSIGIIWLALLLVVAELLIVMSRFVFSYEQVYMSDLVRFWYAALFLFGSAYTLREDAHVRVDVLYTNFTSRTKGLVNALGTLLLGMPFCWLILAVGLSGKTGIINSALLSFEIEGLGDGMYILYLMTVLLGMFAISMLIEFVSFLFNAVADIREDPADVVTTK